MECKTPYNECDFLQISGIQHFSFCRRQWALIHVEGLWSENVRTINGEIFHERAHNRNLSEKRRDLLTVRALRIFSAELGISGECDVVEFKRDEANGIRLQGQDGLWMPIPIEYKSGSSKSGEADRMQLCAQAMCLEEMLCCSIEFGYLFYKETHRREKVYVNSEMKQAVKTMLEEMHSYMKKGYTPKVKTGKHCNACSLKELCLPVLCKNKSVMEYINTTIREDGEER